MKNKISLLLTCLPLLLLAQIEVTTVTESFNGSGGVKIGPDGKVYIADFGQSLSSSSGTQVWRYDPANGELEVFATGFTGASGNDFDSQGNLFQSNINIGAIKKVTPSGTVSTFVQNGLIAPVGIAIDADDNLFVCNCEGASISKISPSGVRTTFSSGQNFQCPNGLTMDGEGNLYASNFFNGNIIKISPNGTNTVFATVPGTPGVGYNGHIIYSTANDILYVASHGSSKIYSLTLQGELTAIAGSGIRGNQDGLAATATFSRPNGIAVSVSGDTLFVNSSIPLINGNGNPLNPSILRMITGVNSLFTASLEQDLNIQDLVISPIPTSHYISIAFSLLEANDVTIEIYDLSGQKIATWIDETLAGGPHQFQRESIMMKGIYTFKIKAGQQITAKRFIAQ